MRSRIALDRNSAAGSSCLPANSTLLMYLGEHVGALEQAGIPLRRMINEGNHRAWKHPPTPKVCGSERWPIPQRTRILSWGFDGDPVGRRREITISRA